jgi:hypothetical protein
VAGRAHCPVDVDQPWFQGEVFNNRL